MGYLFIVSYVDNPLQMVKN